MIRRIGRVATICAAAACLVATPVSLLAAAADTDPPELVSLSIDPASLEVSGFDISTITVTAGLRDPSGVTPFRPGDPMSPSFLGLRRSGPDPGGGHPRLAFRPLTRTSGTAEDGLWTATVRVPSTWDGSWRVDLIVVADEVGNRAEIDPASAGLTADVTVLGRHVPSLSMSIDPAEVRVGGIVEVSGRLWYPDTGEPIAERLLATGRDNLCAEEPLGGTAVRTDANGRYSYREEVPFALLLCVIAAEPEMEFVDEDESTIVLYAGGFPTIGPGRPDTSTETAIANPPAAWPTAVMLSVFLVTLGLVPYVLRCRKAATPGA